MLYQLAFHPVLTAAAVVPAVILLLYVYRADRLEREPVWLLLRLLVLGIIATVGAMIAERVGGFILNTIFSYNTPLYRLLLCFVVVGCSEEGAKYLLLRLRTWNTPYFNCQFDGVVYAVFVSLGFAIWENLSYVFMYGLETALLRAVTAIPGHACFGVLMGAWYGMARRYANFDYPEKSRSALRWAFLLPTLLHGTYDYLAMSQSGSFSWVFVVFVLGLFAVSFLLIRRLSDTDRYI